MLVRLPETGQRPLQLPSVSLCMLAVVPDMHVGPEATWAHRPHARVCEVGRLAPLTERHGEREHRSAPDGLGFLRHKFLGLERVACFAVFALFEHVLCALDGIVVPVLLIDGGWRTAP